MTTESGLERLLEMLKQEAAAIRALEAEATSALYERQDKAGYREKLAAKTERLIGLPGKVAPLLKGLDPPTADRVKARVARFAASAGRARQLGSVFYMAALLYPEDYQEGEKNDLENFIGSL